ncbi:MAG TPA: EAL domain-containing protein [Micromonosporaceae bacterium]
MTENTGDLEALRSQLGDATAAARNAFRDSGRLIRLLTVLSSPAAPEELLQRALDGLSESFNADVVCVISLLGDSMLVTAASGIPEDDRSFREAWPVGPAAAEASRAGKPLARALGTDDADVPQALAGLGLRSAVFVPMSVHAEQPDEILALYRSSGEPFEGTDLHVLGSVAHRLRIAAEDRERAVAIEQLARSGDLLSPHLSAHRLAEAVTELMASLTLSDDAWLFGITDGTIHQRSHYGQADDDVAFKYSRPVTNLQAWPNAREGRPWTDTRRPLPGADPRPRTSLCVPVMRDGEPVALLYVTRNGPRPYSHEVIGIATIFGGTVATAMENASLYRELRHRATRDPLTGLANRDLARQRLDHALAGDSPSFIGLLFCDLDGFKAVNDRLGHETGDELLRQVALRLQGELRTRDLLARFGGDEFVVVLGEIQSLDDITDVGRRLVGALTEPFELHDERVTVSASIGGVRGIRGQTTSGTMLRDADAAMYVAKARGPGAVEVFDDAASNRSLDRLSIRSELLRALDRNEFEVLYQPVVDLQTERTVAFEALLRWPHPVRGPIPPDVFIPLAEETGEIVPIGYWVLEQACRQLAEWQRLPGGAGLRLNVNLSAVQLWQPDAVEQILRRIERSGVRTDDVWLEVTERRYAGDDVTAVAHRLRKGGVHFALDDFGSSYSNLAYLKQFPIDSLKIDRSFVVGVADADPDRSIVRAILAMADSLGLDVVAEGIERPEQRDALIDLGCGFGQGYLFGRALDVGDAAALLIDPLTAVGA